MSQSRDFIVSESGDTMSNHGLRKLVRLLGVLEGFPGMLVSRQVFLFPLLLAGAVGMGGEVVQLGGSLMIFVMRSVVISCGHNLKSHDLPGFGMGFLRKFIGAIRIFKGSFRMPVSRLVIALLIVFGSGPMGVSRKLVLFRSSPVGFVRHHSSCGSG
jgi:hypothetical protein